jgi:hypothetical protein
MHAAQAKRTQHERLATGDRYAHAEIRAFVAGGVPPARAVMTDDTWISGVRSNGLLSIIAAPELDRQLPRGAYDKIPPHRICTAMQAVSIQVNNRVGRRSPQGVEAGPVPTGPILRSGKDTERNKLDKDDHGVPRSSRRGVRRA